MGPVRLKVQFHHIAGVDRIILAVHEDRSVFEAI
jgi:hypothetical protein